MNQGKARVKTKENARDQVMEVLVILITESGF